jgi:hypothetical protein
MTKKDNKFCMTLNRDEVYAFKFMMTEYAAKNGMVLNNPKVEVGGAQVSLGHIRSKIDNFLQKGLATGMSFMSEILEKRGTQQ